MHSCCVQAKTLDELRFLLEVKSAEILAKGQKIYRLNPKRIAQRDLFGLWYQLSYQCTLIIEK